MDRFTEDALRILRAIRFSAQLGFEIEDETEKAIRVIGPNLAHVSKERIMAELTKVLLSDHPDMIKMVFDCGLESYVGDTFSRIRPEQIRISEKLPSLKYLRWAAFLRNQTPEEAGTTLRELKADNDTITKVKTLVSWWDRPVGTSQPQIRRTMSQMTEELYDSLLSLKRSVVERDENSRRECGQVDTRKTFPESQEDLDNICRQSEEIRRRGDCTSLKTLAVTGKDLIQAGMKPGKGLGETLNRLLELVLEHPEMNKKELLIDQAKN